MGACLSHEVPASLALAASPQTEAAVPKAAAGAAPPEPLPADSANQVHISLVDTTTFPTEKGRDLQLRSCNMVDTPPEPRFDAITKLMASIFKTPVSLLTLIVDDRVWFKSKVGPFGACVCRDGSWCNYILVPNKPEVLITEDASQDARFAANPYVAGAPFIKFYAGAPLVGTGGVRYGTLCVVDLKPRSFSAEMYGLLTNFAELAVQELERDMGALGHLQKQVVSFADSHARMGSTVSSSIDGLAMIDVRAKPWPVLYANDTFAWVTGQSVEDCTEQGFWEQFDPVDTDKGVMEQVDAAVASGSPVRIAVRSKAGGNVLSLVLRPAATDQLSPDKPVGVPNWVRWEKELSTGALGIDTSGSVGTIDPQLASCFFLAVVEPAGAESNGLGALPPGTPSSRPMSSNGSMMDPGTPEAYARTPTSMMAFGDRSLPSGLRGLEMGPLIGSGSFAKVYRGIWNGNVVAVKVINCDRPESLAEDLLAEAVLSQGLVNPNIVRTYTYDIDSHLVFNSGKHQEKGTVYIIQQHCNRGTLIDAVEKGWFRHELKLDSPPNMFTILRTLRDVALGMEYLHARSIIHCDLTGNNVLLDMSEADQRGFVGFVSDFGLARVARGGTITSESFGTVTHMAKEVLSDGLLTPAADVWSFGVLCWELFSGTRAYAGLRAPNVVYLVMSDKAPLQLPADAPAGYQALMHKCLTTDPQQRPTFTDIVASLDTLLEQQQASRS